MRLLFVLFFVTTIVQAQEQKPPYWDEIKAFRTQDKIQPPPQHAIVFVGSSSFNYWKDVSNYFPGYTIINRGFGGSSLPDVIRYAGDIIFPFKPRQVVIYCGENDLAASDTVTVETVFMRFKYLFELIRRKIPGVSVVFVSLKPSPSRWNLHQKMIAVNTRIKNFLATQKKVAFVDVYHKMLGADGLPVKEIFGEDNLHMNAKGYAIWQKAIRPYLLK